MMGSVPIIWRQQSSRSNCRRGCPAWQPPTIRSRAQVLMLLISSRRDAGGEPMEFQSFLEWFVTGFGAAVSASMAIFASGTESGIQTVSRRMPATEHSTCIRQSIVVIAFHRIAGHSICLTRSHGRSKTVQRLCLRLQATVLITAIVRASP